VLVGDRGNYRLARSAGDIRVPATVQPVLAARIDRLSPEDRALLQTAAVIGRDVPLVLLRTVADLPEESLRAGLIRLQGSEFLYETRVVPEPEFAFKHALSHEVAYTGLLQDRQRALHARIMTAIEQLHATRLAEQVDRLAHHALRGDVWDKAVAYSREAGAKAAARSAYREAAVRFEQALEALRHLPESRNAIEQRIDLLLELRNSLFALGEFRRIFDYLCEGKILAEQIGDQRRLGWISAFIAHRFFQLSDLGGAVQSGHRALAAAAACGDFALRVVANYHLGLAHLSLGDYARAKEYFHGNVESLKGGLIRERFGEAYLPSVETRVWLVHVLAACGEFAEGITRGEEAVEIAETMDDPFSLIAAYRGLGFLYLRKGDLDDAIRFLERSRELSQAWNIGNFIPGILSYLGHAHALSGRLTDGLSLFEQGIDQAALIGEFSGYAESRADWSEAYRLANREEDAIRIANQALDFARDHKRRAHEAWALRALGEIASHREPPDAEKAEAFYREAMALADELGMRPLIAHCHFGFGKLYGRAGKSQEAREHLAIAATMYRELDMPFWLEQVEVGRL
jgi:tetratricopeptide (TPR) repeat protein